jgi:L-amino acid N-acyltransferase YncA
MSKRHEYALDVSDFKQNGPALNVAQLQLRAAQFTDMGVLAELMIDAYRGTVDDDGETLDDALDEIRAYLAGERGGQPLLTASHVAFVGPQVVGACLVADWQARKIPLIAYVMTRAAWKQRGVGKQLLSTVLQTLRAQGYHAVGAVITAGNRPSEQLLGRMGFRKVSSP